MEHLFQKLAETDSYVGASEESQNDMLVDRYSLRNSCLIESVARQETVYSCGLIRITQSYKIAPNTGEETPAWEDGEGWAEMIDYKVKATDGETTTYEIIDNQAEFAFAG